MTEELYFRILKTGVRLNFHDFMERPVAFYPACEKIGKIPDIDVHFCRSTVSGIKKLKVADTVKEMGKARGRLFCLVYDIRKRRTCCYFEKGLSLEVAVNHAVNKSFLAYQSVLDIIFLHTASVIIGGKVYLFTAPQGGGKTTLSSLAREEGGFEVMDDESCVVKKVGGRFYAGKFPCFMPKTVKYREWEVGGIFFLNKSDENRVRPIPVLEAVRRALPEAVVFYRKPALGLKKTDYVRNVLGFLDAMFDKLDFRLVDFKKTGGIFKCLAIK